LAFILFWLPKGGQKGAKRGPKGGQKGAKRGPKGFHKLQKVEKTCQVLILLSYLNICFT
jgi:hypothetical protein